MSIYLLKEMKEDLKELALAIRNGKDGRKPKNRNVTNITDFRNLGRNRFEFRHMHIAYCLMRGRKMEQIEQPREGNFPKEAVIESYKEKYTYVEDERAVA